MIDTQHNHKILNSLTLSNIPSPSLVHVKLVVTSTILDSLKSIASASTTAASTSASIRQCESVLDISYIVWLT